MSSLFSQVAEVFTRRQAKKVEDREALVTAILAGGKKAPTPAQIATALDEMDWTPEALEKEVARRQQRQADASVLAEIPALEKEKGELEAKGNAEEARYQAVVKPLQAEHAKNMELLNGRYRYIVMRIPQAEGMRNKLIASYAGPLTDELDANRARQGELNREIRTLTKAAEQHEHLATFTKREDSYLEVRRTDTEVLVGNLEWQKVKDAPQVPILSKEEIKTRQADAKSLRDTVAEKQKELDSLVKRESQILEEMLQP